MPAANDPAEPNALMQSLQLTCSLTPSSTLPRTRLVIIWLKRCLARSLIDPALESAPVGVGVGVGVGLGEGEGVGVGDGLGDGEGLGEGEGLCAEAGTACAPITTSESAAVSAADRMQWRGRSVIFTARTACRWDRCRRPWQALASVWHSHNRSPSKVPPPRR